MTIDSWKIEFEKEFVTDDGFIRDSWDTEKIKDFIHSSLLSLIADIREKMPEEGIKWMQGGGHKDRRGYTDGFNTCRAEVISVLESYQK